MEIIAGTSLTVINATLFNQTEILSHWPNGSDTLAGAIPVDALELQLEYLMPPNEGFWEGHIEVTLEGGIPIRMPYIYELVDLNPELEFVTPENLTQTNVVLPISLHAKDTGSGFSLADLSWMQDWTIPPLVPEGNGFDGILWNLSAVEVSVSDLEILVMKIDYLERFG